MSDISNMEIKNKKAKRIIAWIAIILLAAMYLSCLILALCGATIKNDWFGFCLLATIIVPLLAFIIIFLIGRRNDKYVPGDPVNSSDEESTIE